MPKGVYERTPEHNAANSKSRIGRKASDKTRKKMSEAHKGENHPMYGKKATPEARAAMSKAHTGVPLSPSHRAAISEAGKGVPKSPDHCAALSKAKMGHGVSKKSRMIMSESSKNSDIVKANAEAMLGGDDTVWHHTLYDHSDLSKNRVPMTRKSHSMGHAALRKLGIEIPHINMEE